MKLSTFAISCLIFLAILLSSGWFSKTHSIPIDLDEIAWIHDAQVHQWRIDEQWNQFQWDKQQNLFDWKSDDFRLFDQPHFAKYVYGFFISRDSDNPWRTEIRSSNFKLFIDQTDSGKYLLSDTTSAELFGKSTVQSIATSRFISVIFSTLFLFTLFLFLAYKISLLMSSLSTFILTTHPTVVYNLHLATADSIFLLLLLISVILLITLHTNTGASSRFRFLLLFSSAITTALTASTKINGWILLYVFLLFQFANKNNSDSIRWSSILKQTALWGVLFIGTYVYLQPELWNDSLVGFQRFLSQRLTQQHIFARSLGVLNFLDYHYWLLKLFLESNSMASLLLKTASTLFFLFGIISFRKNSPLVKQIVYWISLITPMWLFFYYYARIGFDRYALLPLIVIVLLASWIVSSGLKMLIASVITSFRSDN